MCYTMYIAKGNEMEAKLIRTETADYLTKELRDIWKKEGKSDTFHKRYVQLRRQGYEVLMNKGGKHSNWRVYEWDR